MKKQVPVQIDGRANKSGLANYYSVGTRTIANWVAWGIIVGRMEAGEHIFNVAECDEALFRYTRTNRKEVKKAYGSLPHK